MRSNYKPLGNYIKEVNNRDTKLEVDLLLGVSIQKKFIPSIANTIGTDMSTYKIIKRNQFAYGPVTSRTETKFRLLYWMIAMKPLFLRLTRHLKLKTLTNYFRNIL